MPRARLRLHRLAAEAGDGEPAVTAPGRHVVAVPVDSALAFTAARGWHVIAAPAAWWLEEQEQLLREDEERRVARAGAQRRSRRRLQLVPPRLSTEDDDVAAVEPAAVGPRTACRPGPGPCNRRHAHASPRRTS